MQSYVFLYMYIFICIYTHVCLYAYIYILWLQNTAKQWGPATQMITHRHTDTHAHTQVLAHTHAHTHTHARRHPWVPNWAPMEHTRTHPLYTHSLAVGSSVSCAGALFIYIRVLFICSRALCTGPHRHIWQREHRKQKHRALLHKYKASLREHQALLPKYIGTCDSAITDATRTHAAVSLTLDRIPANTSGECVTSGVSARIASTRTSWCWSLRHINISPIAT